MVRPSVHFRLALVAQPLKSGFRITGITGAECIKLFSGEVSPKTVRDVAPILTCPLS
jgi:hypothetical protein